MTTVRSHQIIDDVEISSALYSFVQKVERTFSSLNLTLTTWFKRSEDRRALSMMSNRMLTDIGLTRSDVAKEVAKNFWQK